MDFKCKCGSKSFFIQSKGSQIGLYCSVCGKWQKWLTKDEVRQFEYETNTLDSKENNPNDDFYEKFALTPWGCLHCAFRDFGLDLPEIPGKMADAIMEDFFEIMKSTDYGERVRMIENIEHENNQNNQTDLYNRLLARISQSAIRVSTVKEPHTYMKAVGTNELKRILAEEFNIQ